MWICMYVIQTSITVAIHYKHFFITKMCVTVAQPASRLICDWYETKYIFLQLSSEQKCLWALNAFTTQSRNFTCLWNILSSFSEDNNLDLTCSGNIWKIRNVHHSENIWCFKLFLLFHRKSTVYQNTFCTYEQCVQLHSLNKCSKGVESNWCYAWKHLKTRLQQCIRVWIVNSWSCFLSKF